MTNISQRTIAKLNDSLDDIEKSLKQAKKALRDVEEEKAGSYKDLPGVEGVFDGVILKAADGTEYEVPANYSAKSRLVYGDKLKMIEENGRTLFKQIHKVDRKKIEGILNKKEGKWYILTDAGSYKILDAAAEFNHAEPNDEAIAVIPEKEPNAPFAALDKLLKPRFVPAAGTVGSTATTPLAASSVPSTPQKPPRPPQKKPTQTGQFSKPWPAPKPRKEGELDLKSPTSESVSLQDLGDEDLR